MILGNGAIDIWNEELESTNEHEKPALDTNQTGQDHPQHNHKYQNQPVKLSSCSYISRIFHQYLDNIRSLSLAN
jgi:hypothetical protein